MHLFLKRSLMFVTLIGIFAVSATAQQARPVQEDGWRFLAGAAPVLSPVFEGSSEYSLSIFPDIRAYYGDRFFASVPEGIGYNVIFQDGWKAGPLAKIRFGRNEKNGGSPFLIAGESDALRGLGDVEAAGEFGGFVEYQYDVWRGRAEIRQGVRGHEGVISDLSLDYTGRIEHMFFSVGPRLTVASADYMATYFGVDTLQSRRSGLPFYEPEGGIASYGVGGAFVIPLDRQVTTTLFAKYSHLGEQPANSPFVEQRGSPHQTMLGIAFGYLF